ncbi:hypothetical protein [Actinocorallia herbida]|uniref:hypothetical protein n=1 Tax=Actinocorallia herbida TaxID=58109 RepID=UPI0014775EAA|nr:hypothetical protein [Actinocorallia herbida]
MAVMMRRLVSPLVAAAGRPGSGGVLDTASLDSIRTSAQHFTRHEITPRAPFCPVASAVRLQIQT